MAPSDYVSDTSFLLVVISFSLLRLLEDLLVNPLIDLPMAGKWYSNPVVGPQVVPPTVTFESPTEIFQLPI